MFICTSATEPQIHFIPRCSLYELQIRPRKGRQVVLSTWANTNTRPEYNSARHWTVMLSLLDTKRICEENRRSLLCFIQKTATVSMLVFYYSTESYIWTQRGTVCFAMRNESKSNDVLSRAISFYCWATVIFLSVKLMYNWTTIIVFSFWASQYSRIVSWCIYFFFVISLYL
jgi:hypothetical protein